MSSRPAVPGAAFDVILEAVREHTHVLLGATIGFSDEQWAQPTGLPGWTRSHVASHLVENARGLVRVCRGLAEGRPARMYPSHADKMRSIERGALAGGLRLQINLDTTASELQTQLPMLHGNSTPVELRAGDPMPADQIPLARLFEVVVHSVDLDVAGHEVHLHTDIALDLLAFESERLGRRPDLPGMLLLPDEGPQIRLGAEGDFSTIGGPADELVLWLARGIVSPRLRGAWDRTSVV
ncbi:maleylpyruvate isomerase family mycothiol-dependent enzyme [Tessaracoccus antarcticus]|uniref:Maleylpyruvate isomerase family mycothiol-dependent enzyme n=1 Tax=Tessaracoccus antarcticus TaxID=2479848 RepID=A0A3M0G562_9ACTN|nr:maleylpyruvate isomerase family mycothiol-dependent enzyme [Tessaracoccus antarcticus]RMB59708.1 maleylpyruvate isomerase family mycothiol-dependent enzyme [Tessaracoccus antarcticus]